LTGLQGSGKTTTQRPNWLLFCSAAAKSRFWLRRISNRPGAVRQLEVLSEKIGAAFYSEPLIINRTRFVAQQSSGQTKKAFDPVILDTAGRLHIDQQMMDELVAVKKTTAPAEVLMVVDAMTGQDAVNAAYCF
jgi:signal recognition particle subunit SRP54